MEKTRISEKFERLSWSNTVDEQEKSVSEYANCDAIDLRSFIMPLGRKDCWENCAKVMSARPDKEIIEIGLELFEWLQDLNWPGAMVIVSRLETLPMDALRRLYWASLEKAKNDEEWSYFLKEACGYFDCRG